MPIDRETVEHVAMLARLELTSEELERYTADLQAILDHFDVLQNIDTDALAPMEHVAAEENVFRPDEQRPSLPVDQALGQAPEEDGQFFRVPQIVE
jgi:aspartyl-tRNA(Asn)/glutamyl-tRNA(Gln) amidotransferase subunit C